MAVFSWFGDACSCTRKKCDPSCMTYAHYLEERKPMTNADRIRAMSDEDLAIILTESFGCPPDGEQKRCFGRDIKCYDCALEWLKEEVKDV